jgi:hypothetical protein
VEQLAAGMGPQRLHRALRDLREDLAGPSIEDVQPALAFLGVFSPRGPDIGPRPIPGEGDPVHHLIDVDPADFLALQGVDDLDLVERGVDLEVLTRRRRRGTLEGFLTCFLARLLVPGIDRQDEGEGEKACHGMSSSTPSVVRQPKAQSPKPKA